MPRGRPYPISREIVEYVLLGPADDRRQLQDSPILGDVWTAFAADPAGLQDLLITPFGAQPAGIVARAVASRVPKLGLPHDTPETYANIAYLQGLVAARLYFEELLRVILPLTQWWQDKIKADAFTPALSIDHFKAMITRTVPPPPQSNGARQVVQMSLDPVDRYVTLTGLLLWAAKDVPAKLRETAPQPETWLAAVGRSHSGKIAASIHKLFRDIISDDASTQKSDSGPTKKEPLVWQVSLNRKTLPALEKSVPAVKADAATTLFSVKCKDIAWAVLDSGIDGSHPAFQDDENQPRVKKAFDFSNIRQIISLDNIDESTREERLRTLVRDRAMSKEETDAALENLKVLAEDAEQGRPIHWELVRRLVEIDPGTKPFAPHGTHVAGILGARREGANPQGLCPDIWLYDFRVLSKSIEDTEFAVIAALQYIRHLNARSSFVAIHGVNLSLSIPHDVRNFACGRTPVCKECERLVDSGLVVVAAAGNRGYNRFETRDGGYEGYTAFSITDPGNADGVITVGSTHRYWPHTYGVSFFSSRGPTGDGRLKPDIVAPGERIRAPLPDNSWGELDGTSMAAPHVSGAAAMLMARYSELIGQPRRIKRILCESATDLGRERSFQGHGMLDVLRAFQSI
jgi:subtilisin family serine protease